MLATHSLERTGIVSRLEQLGYVTHCLENHRQVSSASLKCSIHSGHPLPREPRMKVISRLEMQQSMPATHFLDGQEQALSAGLNFREAY
jgi:hypothetical protein